MLKYFILTTFILSSLGLTPTLYTYKTVQNIPFQAAVYIPTTPPPPQKYPVILALHGGGFITGNYLLSGTPEEFAEILKRGWVFIAINYRLGPGALLPDMMNDVRDAYRWIRQTLARSLAINPNRIVLWGGSAGAALAGIAGYKLLPRPQAIIMLYPFCVDFKDLLLYDPSTPVSEELGEKADSLRETLAEYIGDDSPDLRSEVFHLAEIEKKLGWLLIANDQNEKAENVLKMLKEYSVVDNIDNKYPPTYIVHGLQDEVSPSQSFRMAQALEKNGIVHKIGLVPGVRHVFDLDIDETKWEQHLLPMFDFMEEYLNNRSILMKSISLFLVLSIFLIYW